MVQFECVSRTHIGLRRRVNEDSLVAAAERGLWAVADGMGGHHAGEVASAMVTDALRCLPATVDAVESAAQAITVLGQVNRELIELARANGSERTCTIGTTVVGLAIADGSFSCFWLGDSRAFHLRDGRIVRLTRDHSVVQSLVEAGMITAEEAETHKDSNLITKAVGAAESIDVEVVSGDTRVGDIFLLATDGLTRIVHDEEIAAEMAAGHLSQAADRLIKTVLARGAPDNVSFVIVKLVQRA